MCYNCLTGEDMNTVTRSASGMRQNRNRVLNEDDISRIKSDIAAINADEQYFNINDGPRTGYSDALDIIFVKGDVLPDYDYSTHPRDLLSTRAVLAHEYYGHRFYRYTKLRRGAWNDEFRASYSAAKNAPGLTDKDRVLLILDAMERAKEAGVTIRINNFMRRVIYGIDNSI